MNIKDTIWLIGVVIALGATWGMTSQRVSAMEKSLQLLIRIETRIAVIETEVKHINEKLDK
jgi:RNase P/RNase MRP subunit p30